MRPKLPTDDKDSGIQDNQFQDMLEKRQKDKTETKRHRLTILLTVIGLILAAIPVLLLVKSC